MVAVGIGMRFVVANLSGADAGRHMCMKDWRCNLAGRLAEVVGRSEALEGEETLSLEVGALVEAGKAAGILIAVGELVESLEAAVM